MFKWLSYLKIHSTDKFRIPQNLSKFIQQTSGFANFYQNSFHRPRIAWSFSQVHRVHEVLGVHGIHLAHGNPSYQKRTGGVNTMGENSSFIYTCYSKAVSFYDFSLSRQFKSLAAKEFFKAIWQQE